MLWIIVKTWDQMIPVIHRWGWGKAPLKWEGLIPDGLRWAQGITLALRTGNLERSEFCVRVVFFVFFFLKKNVNLSMLFPIWEMFGELRIFVFSSFWKPYWYLQGFCLCLFTHSFTIRNKQRADLGVWMGLKSPSNMHFIAVKEDWSVS